MNESRWQPGGVIAGWQLVRELGRGGMGVVWEAASPDGRRVALKTLLVSATAHARERFAREAEGQARVSAHRNVVQIHSVGDHEGVPFLVTELLSGGTLTERLKRGGRLEPREAIEVVSALADGLAHAHAQGILHRDIKPANVLFDESGTPKLADFGLAKLPDLQTLTQTGQLLGTLGFMAPEMVDDARSAGPAADVYALGALLFTCLAGKPPLKAGTQVNRIMALLREPAPSLSSQRPDAPPALEAICARALERDPAARFPNATSIAEALRGATLAQEPGRGSRGALVLLSLLVLGGLLAALGYALSRPPAAASPPPVTPSPSPSLPPAPEATWRLPERGELRYRVKWQETGFAGAESRADSVIVLQVLPLDATHRQIEARWEFSEFASVRDGQVGAFVAADDLAKAKDYLVFKGQLDLVSGAWKVELTPDTIREELRRRVDPEGASRKKHDVDEPQTDAALWAGTWAASFFDAHRLPRLLEILFSTTPLKNSEIAWRERPGLDRLRGETSGRNRVIYSYLWTVPQPYVQRHGDRRRTEVEGERFRAEGLPSRVALTQVVSLIDGRSAKDVLEIELER